MENIIKIFGTVIVVLLLWFQEQSWKERQHCFKITENQIQEYCIGQSIFFSIKSSLTPKIIQKIKINLSVATFPPFPGMSYRSTNEIMYFLQNMEFLW